MSAVGLELALFADGIAHNLGLTMLQLDLSILHLLHRAKPGKGLPKYFSLHEFLRYVTMCPWLSLSNVMSLSTVAPNGPLGILTCCGSVLETGSELRHSFMKLEIGSRMKIFQIVCRSWHWKRRLTMPGCCLVLEFVRRLRCSRLLLSLRNMPVLCNDFM